MNVSRTLKRENSQANQVTLSSAKIPGLARLLQFCCCFVRFALSKEYGTVHSIGKDQPYIREVLSNHVPRRRLSELVRFR
jgi:hypothetical protein